MHCPFCFATDTKVADSRSTDDGNKIRRRRVCNLCNARFSTYESIDLTLPRIIKTNGSRENFDKNKILTGILRSLEKRPVATKEVDEILVNIEQKIATFGKKEITSSQIGELVLHELKRLDEVAYIRFASVYKSFQDVSAFIEMIGILEKETLTDFNKNQMKLLLDKN